MTVYLTSRWTVWCLIPAADKKAADLGLMPSSVCRRPPTPFISCWSGHGISATCGMIIRSFVTLLSTAVHPHDPCPPSPWQPKEAVVSFPHLPLMSAGEGIPPGPQHAEGGLQLDGTFNNFCNCPLLWTSEEKIVRNPLWNQSRTNCFIRPYSYFYDAYWWSYSPRFTSLRPGLQIFLRPPCNIKKLNSPPGDKQ